MADRRGVATLEYIRDAAMRYDTAMARAFRKALGLDPRPMGRSKAPRCPKNSKYDGMRELMAQRHGVRW